jgi:hypothetical protein
MKAYGAVDVQIHIFLISTLAGGEWSASLPGRPSPLDRALGTIGYEAGWTADPVWTIIMHVLYKTSNFFVNIEKPTSNAQIQPQTLSIICLSVP